MTIGIPKALIYWKRPYFWESFFENLGFEVLLSPETNKEIVEQGVKAADAETCFSNKVFWGHLLWLEEKCDLIFVPRLKANEEKLEYCPKFFGLPDLAKILAKTAILTATFDERKEKFEKTIEKLGKKLNKNKEEIKKAQEIALSKEEFKQNPAPYAQYNLAKQNNKCLGGEVQSKKPKIILISHPYNLYDDYVNLRMKEKLEKLGAEPIFIDEVPISVNQFTPLDSFASNGASQRESTDIINSFRDLSLNGVKFHWEFGKEIMEKVQEILKYDTCPVASERSEDWCGVLGAIQISSFACGCDAVLKEFVEKEFKIKKIPFLYLLIDEQTGEAGLQTRLEAFIDTLK